MHYTIKPRDLWLVGRRWIVRRPNGRLLRITRTRARARHVVERDSALFYDL